MIGEINLARKVTLPSNKNTGIAANILPFPKDDVITPIMIKSSTAFSASVE